MKTEKKVLVNFLAAAVWADGSYDEFEKEFVGEIQEELEIPTLVNDVDKQIKKFEKMSEDEISEEIEKAAKSVDVSEKEGILDLCLQIMCADGYLAMDEINNYFAFADFMGIADDKAEEIMDAFVDETEDLIIEEE